jgi:hypothetical protein
MQKFHLLYLFLNNQILIVGFVRTSFELGLHSKDKDTLQKIKKFLVVGRICNRKIRDMVSFAVTKIKDLTTVIIPHFSRFQLKTQKRVDFEL